MTFQILDSQTRSKILADRDGQNWRAAYADVYQAITQITYDAEQNPYESPVDGVDEAVWLWVKGGAAVNANSGAFASYIRNYTARQYQLRTGNVLDNGQPAGTDTIQTASDAIIQNFLGTLIETNNWEIPTLHIVGLDDAAAAASGVFKIATTSGQANSSPWAGTVLFTDLGDDSFFKDWILTNSTSGFKQEPGTYDLVSAAQVTTEQATLGQAFWVLTTQLGTYLETQRLGATSVPDADQAAQQFFEKTYGSGVSPIHVGDAIFGSLTPLLTPADAFRVGTIRDDSLSVSSTSTEVVQAGQGNDTVTVLSSLGTLSMIVAGEVSTPLYGPRVLDGGTGENALRYTIGDNLQVHVQTISRDLSGLDAEAYANGPRWRMQVSGSDNPSATDLDYNFQKVTFGAGSDAVILDGGVRLQDLTNPDGTPGLKSLDGGGGNNTLDLSGDAEKLQVGIKMAPADQAAGTPATLTTQISGVGSPASSLLATNFQQLSLGAGDDTIQIDPNLPTSTKLVVSGGGGNNTFNIGGGTETLIGGTGNNSFALDEPSGAPTSDIVWGGGGTSTYYINGSPDVYIYYMDNPTLAKVSALTPTLITSAYPQIRPTPAHYAFHFAPAAEPNGDQVFIINPGPQDKIYNNGVLLGDLDSRIAGSAQSAYTRDPTPLEGDGASYLYTFTPPSFVPGIILVNFAFGDFGLTYSGPTDTDPTSHNYLPSQASLDYNAQLKLNVQSSAEAGNQLDSANGNIMAGTGAVTYGIAADTPNALISSQDGSQGAVVSFRGSTTPDTLSLEGGGGTDGLGLVLQDRTTGQTATIVDGLGGLQSRISAVAFSGGQTLSYAQILQTLTIGSTTQTKLYGDTDANVIDSGGYATYAQGNGGGDTLVYNAGYGQLEVNEVDQGASSNNILQLGSGISAAQLAVTADASGNLYIADGTAGDQIKLDSQLNGSANGVQSVLLADGSSLSAAQLIALETRGTSSADTLYGTSDANVLDGKGAPAGTQDYTEGKGGGDTFVYNAGYGRLEINEIDQSPTPDNVLQFGPGITASQLTVTTDGYVNLLVSDGTPGDQIKIDGLYVGGAKGVQSVTFADGSSLTAAQLASLATTGTPRADILYGFYGPDILDGKGAPAGSRDQEYGLGGGDTFIYNAGYGQLEIGESQLGSSADNVLRFGPGVTASQLAFTIGTSGSLYVADGTPGDQIQIDRQFNADGNGLQGITFADGSSLTAAQLAALAMAGTPGADLLYGTSGADVLDGKGAPAGSEDVEQGNGGGDAFIYNAGYGQLEIKEVDQSSTPANVLRFGAGVTASQLAAGADALGNLYVTDGTPGDQIQIDGQLSGDGSGVQSVTFADGSSLTAAQLDTLATVGSSGADTLYGTSGADVFDGRGAPTGSQDFEQGNGGGDTFVFNQGYGQLEISQYDRSLNPASVLQFGPGITASQLTATADLSGNLYVTDGTPGDRIQIDGQLNDIGLGVQRVIFADGSSLTAAQLDALVAVGTAGADTLYGSWGADLLDGKGAPTGSQDYEHGNGGGDAFIFDQGYGQLEIDEFDSGANPNNVLQFGPGITASQLTVSADAYETVYVTDGTPGDRIQIDYQGDGSTNGVQSVTFADGSSLTAAQLATLATTGTPSADLLYGLYGADVFDGRGAAAGSQDYEEGKGGGDTFVFNQGYGHLEINELEYDNSVNNIVQFGPGITDSQLTVTADASGNLFLTDGTLGDRVQIDGQRNGSYYGVQGVRFADGSSFTAPQLAALTTIGTSGADTLYGTSGADVFDGKGAPAGMHDLEQGKGGADTFFYNTGYGQLEISEDAGSFRNSAAVLQLGAGVSAAALSASLDNSGNVFLSDGVDGDLIKIDNQTTLDFGNARYGVAQIDFADGSALTVQQIPVVPRGTAEADNLRGTQNAETFDGKGAPAGSQDYEQGDGGDDTFMFNVGYGHLEIDELDFGSSPSNVLQIGPGISASQLSVITDTSGNMYLADGMPGDLIKLDGQNAGGFFSVQGVQGVQFADGSTLTASQLSSLATTGPAVTIALSNDTGSSSADRVTMTDVLAGSGDVGATVTIKNGSAVLGTTTADSTGNWTYTPAGLADGSYTLIASETDAVGNTGTATLGFTLDTTAPAVALALASDTGASSTDEITLAAGLSGMGDANATVTILNGASALGTTTADSTGRWSFTPTGLVDGSYTLTALEADVAGNTANATLGFTLDTTAPAVTIGLASDTGASSTDGITSAAGLSGSGDANATVTIRKGTAVLGTTTADSTGHWSYTPTGLTDGSYTLTASETDPAGNSGTGTLALTLDRVAPHPGIGYITGNADGGITLSGFSEPGSNVSVTDTVNGNTIALGTATTASNTGWQVTSHVRIDTSTIHAYSVTAYDAAGNAGVFPGKLYLASTGVDTLSGTSGVSDIFAIISFKGSDVINGFQPSSVVGATHDYIDFSGRGITSFSQVQSMMSGTTSTVINIGSGKTITVSDIAPSTFTAADFRYS